MIHRLVISRAKELSDVSLDEPWPNLDMNFAINLDDSIEGMDSQGHCQRGLRYFIAVESNLAQFTRRSAHMLLVIEPVNEVAKLYTMLQEFISGRLRIMRFEPIQPCFELNLEYINPNRIKLVCWLDLGYNLPGAVHQTWDAYGLRMIVDRTELCKFAAQLASFIDEHTFNI